jgi:Zn-dependent M16 (insulinase) family peptidase
MFKEMLPNIGTKNYKYDVFHEKMMNCSSGLNLAIDKFSATDDDLDSSESLLLELAFLDRFVDEACESLAEIMATPNFDDTDNMSDLIRMGSVTKAQNLGNRGLEYARSYADSGLKAFAKSYEELNSDIFFCQFAQEMLSTSNPHA